MARGVDISSIADSLLEWEGSIDEFLDGVIGTFQAAGSALLGGKANPSGDYGEWVPPQAPRRPAPTDPARSTYRDANIPRAQMMSPDANPGAYYGRGNLGQAYDLRNADHARTGFKPSEVPLSKMDTYHQDPREFQPPSAGAAPDQGGRRQTHRYGHPINDYGIPRQKPLIRQAGSPVTAHD